MAFIQRNYVAFIQYHQTGIYTTTHWHLYNNTLAFIQQHTGIYTTTHWHLYIESGWGIYANRKLRGGPDPKSDKK